MEPVGSLSRRGMLALGAGGLAAGCGRRRHGGRPLVMWAMGTEGDNGSLMLPPFRAATGLRVSLQSLPWTAAHEKILTSFAGDALPDVLMVFNRWISELALLGALAPVPPALLAGQHPAALAAVTVGGRARALPWSVDTMVQFFRRDRLAEAGYPEPPPDWREWKRMAHAIKRRHPDRFAALMLLDWPEHLFGYAAQQPEPLLRDADTRGNFRSAGFRAVLAHYKSLFDEGLAPRVVGTDISDTITVMMEGWIAIAPAGGDFLHDLRLHAPRFPADRWGAALMPGPDGPATGPVEGHSLGVAHSTADPADAWTLAGWFGRGATEVAFGRVTGKLPSRPAAWADPAVARDPACRVLIRQLADTRAAPAVPEWQRILDEVQLIAERMVRGEFGVDAAARAMDARVDDLLAKRRWLLDRGRIAA